MLVLRGVSAVLHELSSSLSEPEPSPECRPSGIQGGVVDDERDLFANRNKNLKYLGGDGEPSLRGEGDLVTKRFFRLDPRPWLALSENE